ncbi:MAG: ketoacyl-ACP synthase III [Gammaproteobacteria bacterium]|nr:ketoacyl-ACP synthase III [Gammaproteobacteria bacterium]NND53603.1 ketoacyl-ACP synthase III [Gammaproteobacteria bacterium]
MSLTEAVIRGIALELPDDRISNEWLREQHPDWPIDKIAAMTGISERRQAPDDQTALDLAESAARRLLAEGPRLAEGEGCAPFDAGTIDTLLYCTQSPDYIMPTNACLLQERLGLPTSTMAFDYNLGCTGYVYGLGIARALIASGQSQRVLLITGETISRYMSHDDRNVRTVFGDAATATMIDAGDGVVPGGVIGAAVYGTDGSGAPHLMVANAGYCGKPMDERSETDRDAPTLFMDGAEVFAFTLSRVPQTLNELYEKAGVTADEIDRFVFHQANQYMLNHLRRKLRIPEEKFILEIGDVGNTSSNTIPIALARAFADGRIAKGQRTAMVGFGVGLSWGSVLLDWR